MKKTVKGKRGITLVALVITIIVLLILAGITINLTVGQDGILTTAQQAGKNYVASADEEQADLDDLSDYLSSKIAVAGEKVKDLTKTVTVDGVETTVIIGEKISDGTGASVPVPTGFYYVGGTVAKGAVISNNEADKDLYKGQEIVGTDLVGNQYVFIPCTTDGANGTLQYKRTDDGSWRIIWSDGILASKDELTLTGVTPSSTGTGITEAVLEEIVAQVKEEMTSVEKYGGYYIGRYEVGNVSNTAVIKAKVEPYTNIQWSVAYGVAKGIAVGDSATSYLCSSYAWDTAINFIQNNGTLNYATTLDGFNENWQGREVKDSAGNVIKGSGGAMRLKTGKTTAKSNIYDMGGNVREFTTEIVTGAVTTDGVELRVVGRGGKYYNGDHPAGDRRCYMPTDKGDSYGFRATLFLK